MSGGGTGENNISDGYVPKKELNNFINGMIAAVRLVENKKRNPSRRKKSQKKITRRKNPSLFLVGRLLNGKVSFFNGGYPLSGVWGTRAKAAKYNLQSDGVKAAEAYLRKHKAKFQVFVIPNNETTTAIKKKLGVYTGKA